MTNSNNSHHHNNRKKAPRDSGGQVLPHHSEQFEKLQKKFANPQEFYVDKSIRQPPPPATSIMLKGLPLTVLEDEIRNTVYRNYGLIVTNVKIARDKFTGVSRGFGFLDFDSLETSKSLMESTNGGMYIGQEFITIEYSRAPVHKKNPQQHQQQQQSQQQNNENGGSNNDTTEPKEPTTYKDWICEYCHARNFSHRSKCLQCQIPRTVNAVEVISKEDQIKPTVELIVRGLSLVTNEATIAQVFTQYAQIKSCRVIRDKLTMISRQFAFVEFFSIEDSTRVLNEVGQGLNIDGVFVHVAFAKRQHIPDEPPISEEEIALASWSSYYNYTGDNANNNQASTVTNELAGLPGYTFDESTGYYYNPQSNFYFDPKTTYFFDNNNQYWVYYDEHTQTYIPVESEKAEEAKVVIGPALPEPSEAENVERVVFSGSKKKKDKLNVKQWNQNVQLLKEEMKQPTVVQEELPPVVEEPQSNNAPSTADEQVLPNSEVIGKGFVPNPAYQKALKRVETHEKELEFEKFQAEISSIAGPSNPPKKSKKRKRSEMDLPKVEKAPEIDENNVGNKLLKKLGWTEGEGLGKNKSGIVAPVGAGVRGDRLGLGLASTASVEELSYSAQQRAVLERMPGDTYQDVARKRARARYEQLK